MIKQSTFSGIILIVAAYIWVQFISTFFMDYDKNVNYFILTLTLSLLYVIVLCCIWLFAPKVVEANKMVFKSCLLSSNPLSIIIMTYAAVQVIQVLDDLF